MEPLLAKEKSESDVQRSSLFRHLQLTYLAAKNLCDETQDSQLRALKLDVQEYGERFRKILLLAAATHDIGKANSLFQEVLAKDDAFQSLRHEWVSYLLLRYTEFGSIVKQALPEATREQDFNYLVWCVASHHRKNEGEIVVECGESGMKLLLDEPSFGKYYRWLEEETELFNERVFTKFNPSSLAQARLAPLNQTLGEFLAQTGCVILRESSKLFYDDQSQFEEICRQDRLFFSALRSSLIAADVAASAANDVKTGLHGEVDRQLTEWFQSRLGHKASREDITKIVAVKKSEFEANDSSLSEERAAFQQETTQSDSRVTLCIAGCGSGKTLAAWKWAAANCPREGARVFFCYPTTGTATAGFVDYLIDPENKTQLGSLFHSRTPVDEDFIQKEFALQKKDLKDQVNADAIMSSLKTWGSPIVCCTVDFVLRLLVNEYAGILSWPALSQSIFIFDEVHSYDAKLFHWLKEFLKIVKGAKILLLSASLSENRREQLRKIVEKKNSNERLNVVYGPKRWEEVKRYQRFVDSEEEEVDPIELALERFHRGEKVLWVCNTVARARQTIDELQRREPDVNALAYHSRFKYIDRLDRQKDCVEAFQKDEPAICVTTQVAEMSLDLSADFLISDLAPIPALIQRLGRLNRRAVTDSPRPFYIDVPTDDQGEIYLLPYIGEEYQDWAEQAQGWLDLLGTEPASQADLTRLWNKTEAEKEIVQKAPWLIAGPWNAHEKQCLREASSTIQILLDEDLDAVKHGRRKKFIELAIPIVRPRFEIKGRFWDKYGCYLFTKDREITYDPKLGAAWSGQDSSNAARTSSIANTIF